MQGRIARHLAENMRRPPVVVAAPRRGRTAGRRALGRSRRRGLHGALAASASTVKMGSTLTVTDSGPTLGNRRCPGSPCTFAGPAFAVVRSTPPRTGICCIAGSATCSFPSLTGHETQTYTLTLSPQAPWHAHPPGLDHVAPHRARIRPLPPRDLEITPRYATSCLHCTSPSPSRPQVFIPGTADGVTTAADSPVPRRMPR